MTADKAYVEIFGTSSESKPTSGIITGSSFTEVDTGDRYLFNETASEWVKQPAQGGGSGGGVLVVTDTDGTLDKTWQEIHDADFAVIKEDDSSIYGNRGFVKKSYYDSRSNNYVVNVEGEVGATYSSSSADGYPVISG